MNENDKKRRYERYNQRFRLLIDRKDFQLDIQDFRRKWLIDPNLTSSFEGRDTWRKDFVIHENKWMEKYYKEYAHKIRKAEAEESKGAISYIELMDMKEAIGKEKPINAFHIDIEDIVKKYKLPPMWCNAIENYIFTNNSSYKGFVGIKIKFPFSDEDNVLKDRVVIELDAHTTKKELMSYWPEIKSYLEKLKHSGKKKYQPISISIYERNKLVFDLKESGKQYKEIAEILNNKYPKNDYTYSDAQAMFRHFKKYNT